MLEGLCPVFMMPSAEDSWLRRESKFAKCRHNVLKIGIRDLWVHRCCRSSLQRKGRLQLTRYWLHHGQEQSPRQQAKRHLALAGISGQEDVRILTYGKSSICFWYVLLQVARESLQPCPFRVTEVRSVSQEKRHSCTRYNLQYTLHACAFSVLEDEDKNMAA